MTAHANTPVAPARPAGDLRTAPSRAGRPGLPLPVWIYLICVVLPLGTQVGPLAITLLRLCMMILIVPMFIGLVSGRAGRILPSDWLFVLHILWSIVALAVNNPGQMVEQVGSLGIEMYGGYLLGRIYIRSIGDFLGLARALVVIVLCLLPLAVAEAVMGRRIALEILSAIPGLRTLQPIMTESRLGLTRVQSVFAHPIHYGLFCSVVVPLCFVALKDSIGTVRRWLTSLAVGIAGFLALSSGALLAVFLQIGLIVWSAIFARFRQRWWLLVGLFALAYIAVDLLSNRSPMRVFMSYATFSPHNAYWRAAIFEYGMDNVWAHPVFGIGLNDWARPAWMHSGSVDNYWLVIAMRYGIPGFLLLAAGWILALARIMRLDLDGDPALLLIRRAWVFTFLGLAFTLSTVHIWHSLHSFVYFLFGAGLWLVTAMPQAGEDGEAEGAAGTAGRRSLPPASGRVLRPTAAMPAADAAPAARDGLRFSRFTPRPGQRQEQD